MVEEKKKGFLAKTWDRVKHVGREAVELVKDCGKAVAKGAAAVGTALGIGAMKAQAAVPVAITDAIDDVETAGAAVFAALVVVSLPFILWKLIRKIRG